MFSILLIEQNATLREIMCTFLRKNNYKVTTAFDAAEAQNHLEKHYIDMLVVDIDTTRMANDLEFLKELEILDYNLPAFAFLSATDIKTKAACYEYGADGVLPNHIFTRTQLMDEIWDYDCESGEKTVNTHINRLRKKFKNNKDFEIITIKNLGYKAVLNNISAPPPAFLTKIVDLSNPGRF